jgi:hypothetical protein
MGFLIGGLLFGSIIGYLCSKIFHPENQTVEDPNNFKNISALVALLLGAGILAVFQPGSSGFLGYTLGIFGGFFYKPVWHFIRQESKANREQRIKDYEEEINRINRNWAAIESTIYHKLQRRLRPNNNGIYEAFLPIHDLNELGYSVEGKLTIMQAYARSHISTGVELKSEKNIDEESGIEEEIFYLYQLGQYLTKKEGSSNGNQLDKRTLPAQFISTYHIGDEKFDDSFPLYSTNGEFLGECGVGVSEALGNFTPRKVMAFEVWLFDTNETMTQTKVLASSYAFSDPVIRLRLAKKGDLIRAQKGRQLVLETQSLQVIARALDVSYGVDVEAPKESFFDQIKIELSVNLSKAPT